MANQNLSQFGEKLFVADADHTFIWDTAASISKKVSRNSWLNSGTLTSDAPVTISQTWNAVGQTFKALVVNAAGTSGTNSAAGSLLLDLQVGGVTQASANKSGQIGAASFVFAADSGAGLFRSGNNRLDLRLGSTVLAFAGGQTNGVFVKYQIGFDSSGDTAGTFNYTQDTILLRDGAANTLALRNGAAAQTFNVYGTSSASNANYARLALTCGLDGNATISTQALGTGTAGVLAFSPGNSERMRITTAGNVGIGTTAPGAPLHVQATAITGRESIIKASVSDDATSAFHLYNATSANNKFVPGFSGAVFDNTAFSCMLFAGQTNAANDTGTNPVVVFAARTTDSTSDPNNGTLAAVANRPLFSWQNLAVPQMQMAANGNLGIGTTSPTSKLHVALNPAANYTTETVRFGNIHFANGIGGYTFMWMGSISTPITLSASNFILASDGSGTILNSPSTSGIYFRIAGSDRWSILNDGHLRAATDNTYDIGASGASRPRNVYAGTSFLVAATTIANQVAAGTYLSVRNNSVFIDAPSSGVLLLQDSAGTSFGRFQLGGTTDAFPAITRDGAGIKFTGAAAGSTSWIKVPPVAVSALPAAATAGAGARAFVSDALSPTFGSAVTGGGSTPVPVYSTGSAWNVG